MRRLLDSEEAMDKNYKIKIFNVETHNSQIVPTRGCVVNFDESKTLMTFTNTLPRPLRSLEEAVSNHNSLIVKVAVSEEMPDEKKEQFGIDKDKSFKFLKEITQFDLTDNQYKIKLLQFIDDYIETMGNSNGNEE